VVEVVARDPIYDVRWTFQLSGADRARVDTSSRRQPVNLSEPRTTRIFRPLQRTMEALRHKSNKNPKWRPEGLYITLLRIATRNQAVPGEMVLMDLKLQVAEAQRRSLVRLRQGMVVPDVAQELMGVELSTS